MLSDLSDGVSKLDANPDPSNTFIDTINLGTSGSLGSDSFIDNISIEPIPEPSSLALLGIGALGLMGYGWRRKRSH